MNKTLVYLSLILFSIGCEREIETSYEARKMLYNKSNKILYYKLKTNINENEKFVFFNDTITFSFISHDKVKLPLLGPYHLDIKTGVFFLYEELYNLSDTLSFILDYNDIDECDSVFLSNIILSTSGTEVNFVDTYLIIFTDSLNTIMQKDYTMLEKFKDYYKK